MINRCGYVYFNDSISNINNIATVIVYEGNNVADVNDKIYSIYKYNIITNKIVSYNENEASKISYLNLIDVIGKSLQLDKANEHILKYTFNFDINERVNVYNHSVIKECFPLPYKNLGFYKNQDYYNFTKNIFSLDVTSNLFASVACDHLNNIAVNNGFVSDRMFEHSCGRVFLNLNMFSQSLEGRKLLKNIIGDFKDIKAFTKIKLNSLFLKRVRVSGEYVSFGEDKYSNFVLEHHINTALNFKDYNLIDTLVNTDSFCKLLNYELNMLTNTFEKMYLPKFLGLKSGDIYYLTYEELLKLLFGSEFSYNIASHIANVKKIYNANKHRKIVCLKTDGSIYCIH